MTSIGGRTRSTRTRGPTPRPTGPTRCDSLCLGALRASRRSLELHVMYGSEQVLVAIVWGKMWFEESGWSEGGGHPWCYG